MLYWRIVMINSAMWLVHEKCGMGVEFTSGINLSQLMDSVLAHKCDA